MRIFRKREEKLGVRQEKLAGRVAGWLLKSQRIMADYLNRKTAGLSRLGLLMGFVSFCLAFGGYCGYLLVRAFH